MILAGASESHPVASLLILIVVVGVVVLVQRITKRRAIAVEAGRAAALDRARDQLAAEGQPPTVIVACTTPVSCVNPKGTPYWFSDPRIVALAGADLVTFDQHGHRCETVPVDDVVSTVITRSAYDVTPVSGTKRSYRPYDAEGHALLVQLDDGVRRVASARQSSATRHVEERSAVG